MVGDLTSRPASTATTSCGIDHVRLVYSYLDAGEFDGYASLLDEHVQLHGVWAASASGRQQAVDAARAATNPAARHELYKIIAAADSVVVTGRYQGLDFADVFTISEDALVLCQRRFHYLEPVG